MKTQSRWWLAVLLLIAFCTGSWTIGRQQPAHQQWEYTYETSGDAGRFNELGSKGWELVTISVSGGYYFKRPK
jgi:hypothetical protein